MSERNPYFPHLFSPLKVGTKTIKNRIEAAPALFAFLHLVEAPFFNYYGPGPERAFRMLEAKAAGGAGSIVLVTFRDTQAFPADFFGYQINPLIHTVYHQLTMTHMRHVIKIRSCQLVGKRITHQRTIPVFCQQVPFV